MGPSTCVRCSRCTHNAQLRLTSFRIIRRPLVRHLQGPRATKDSDASSSQTLKSLDSLLGSLDDQDTAPAASSASPAAASEQHTPSQQQQQQPPQQQQQQSLQAMRETLVQEARAKPQIAYLLYYLTLLVYASYFAVDLLQGSEAAEEVAARVMNDHVAVADGDVLRLFTCGFVTLSLQQLVTTLLALFSIGTELESIMGPPAFWAIYSLATITGGLADAAFSPWPVTYGPAAALAGMVGALLAHIIHNEQLEGAPQQLLLQRMGQLAGQQQQQQQGQQEGQESAQAAAGPGRKEAGAAAEQEEEDLKPKRVEFFEGLELTLLLPKEGRLWVDAVGFTAASFTILETIYSTSKDTASWQSILVGFLIGACLGWGLGPVYRVEEVAVEQEQPAPAAAGIEAGSESSSRGASSSSSAAGNGSSPATGNKAAVVEATTGGSSQQQQQQQRAVTRQLRLVDKVSAVHRFNVALGLSGVVFAAAAGWLLSV